VSESDLRGSVIAKREVVKILQSPKGKMVIIPSPRLNIHACR
jgi:hypothetical protein